MNRTGCAAILAVLSAPAVWTQAPDSASAQLKQGGPLRLSLKEAVRIALSPEGNTRVQIASEQVNQAKARSAQSRAALLPNFDSYVTGRNQTRNLAAFGLRIDLPVAGFRLPTLAGPFTTFDVRAQASQSVFDFSSIRRFQSSRAGVRVAESERSSAEDETASVVAKAYLAALVTDARSETAQANVELAEALVSLASNQKQVGTGTGIEVTRARVQLANQKQQLLVAQNEQRQARLQLLRVMGLQLDSNIELTERLSYVPVDPVTLEAATETALKARPDLKAQQTREETARLSYSATKLERLPSLLAFGDYGTIGTGINSTIPTRTYGVSLRLPIFDGGRRDARRSESVSQFRRERVRTKDLQQQIALEVTLALDSLRSAEEQVKVAEEGLSLAEAELAQARRRYEAGVANGVEVTDAQTRLERASQNRIAALYAYNAARLDLGQATGSIRQML